MFRKLIESWRGLVMEVVHFLKGSTHVVSGWGKERRTVNATALGMRRLAFDGHHQEIIECNNKKRIQLQPGLFYQLLYILNISQFKSYHLYPQQHVIHLYIMNTQHFESLLSVKSKIKLEHIAEVIDYQYNQFGNKLAVSDSEGNVVVYSREGEKFVYHSQFRASNSSIWKISWAHPKFGELIAVGSFCKKVAIFQFRGNEWVEVAFHESHEASVNEVIWAPYYFGLKLFACSSDGFFSLLEIKDNNWSTRLFRGHELSINSIAVQKRSVLESYQGYENTYPLIVTASKDKTLALWAYQQGEYHQKLVHTAHREPIRRVLWRQPAYRQSNIEIFSCSDDGELKNLIVKNNAFVEKTLLSESNPIVKISQSPTGDMVIGSFQRGDVNTSLILKEEEGEWVPVEEFVGEK